MRIQKPVKHLRWSLLFSQNASSYMNDQVLNTPLNILTKNGYNHRRLVHLFLEFILPGRNVFQGKITCFKHIMSILPDILVFCFFLKSLTNTVESTFDLLLRMK